MKPIKAFSFCFFDYLESENVLAIEWSENISDALPNNTIYVEIKRIDENTRHIIVKGDKRFEDTCC